MNLFQLFQRSKPGEHKIRYIVRGNAENYNVTFKCSQECKVIQEPQVSKGWKHTFVGKAGDYVYVLAQSNRPDSEVEVKILKDGKLVSQATKSGDYPVVQLSGYV